MESSFTNVGGHKSFLTRFCTPNFTLEIIISVGEFIISDRGTEYMKLFRKSFHGLATHQPKRDLETMVCPGLSLILETEKYSF